MKEFEQLKSLVVEVEEDLSKAEGGEQESRDKGQEGDAANQRGSEGHP